MIVTDAAPEVVLKAITDNDELPKWFPGNAILEPKIGDQVKFSSYEENSERRKRDFFHEGEVGEYIPNKKIAYTWRQSDIPDFPSTLVTWELDEIDKNKTRVELVHFGFTGKKLQVPSSHAANPC